MKRRILLLGSTGSIGDSTLDVVRNLPQELELTALVAGGNWEKLLEQAREFRPVAVGCGQESAAEAFEMAFREAPWEPVPRIYAGDAGLVALVEETEGDMVLGAISGAAGLPAVLAGLETGKDLALANKEALVMAGSIVMRRARELGRKILPVDSEHSAIFQCLQAGQAREVRRIMLTASGGPFRTWSKSQMESVTPEQALKHPTWNMGAKITIDSATLMNKALEIIEARWLFDLPPEQIGVVVHPQSIVHSIVEFVDGSQICHLGPPDMKVPIQYALTYPERRLLPGTELSLADIGQLTFESPDLDRFPSLRLAYEALRAGGTASTVLNAANEVAVELFLQGKLPFLRIFEMLEVVLAAHKIKSDPDLETIFEADRWAREEARSLLTVGPT
jgi:1-deoxy-D-xylulose-5-phosphate reductoisomerase